MTQRVRKTQADEIDSVEPDHSLTFDQALREVNVSRGPQCTMCRTIQTMPPESARQLQAALDNPARTSSAISQALMRMKYRVSSTTVRRHRAKDCAGARDERG